MLAVIVVLGLGWFFIAGNKAPEQAATTTPSSEVAGATGENTFVDGSKDGAPDATATAPAGGAPSEVTVTYSASGFSPASVTIKQGTKVTFTSTDGSAMWVGVDDHPTHTKYTGTTKNEHCASGATSADFDQCTKGSTYSFVFDKEGTWGYHNHVQASATGVVVVTN